MMFVMKGLDMLLERTLPNIDGTGNDDGESIYLFFFLSLTVFGVPITLQRMEWLVWAGHRARPDL